MQEKKERCYIVKEPGEQLHEILVADVAEGKVWAFSKIEPDDQISYKVYIEDRQKQVEVLTTGRCSEADYRPKLAEVMEARFNPADIQWRSVEPVIIEK